MRALLAAALASTLIFAAFACAPKTIVTGDPYARLDIQRVEASVAKLTWKNLDGTCSAWAVRTGLYFSAAHCQYQDPMVNGWPAVYTKVDERLLLIRSSLALPVLSLEREGLRVGDPIAGVGYAFGAEEPMWAFGRVTTLRGIFQQPQGVAIYGHFMFGQSGGPILNMEGRVVGLIERAGMGTLNGLSYGVGAQDLLDFLRDYHADVNWTPLAGG